jgi:nucleoside-diphosphate-sugar epimerase
MRTPLADDLERALAPAGDLWHELRGARIFVTGGTGFFGCWLLEALLWACDAHALDASVVVLTRKAGAFSRKAPHLASHGSLTLHTGDVRAFEFPSGRFTHVVHAATESGTPLGDDQRLPMFDTIVSGTRRVLEFARRAGARRVLLTSSGAVYGRQPAGMDHVAEDYAGGPDPLNAALVYAEAKRAAEMLCALHADSALEPAIARCFAFVGPHLPIDAHFAVGNFIRDGINGGPIRVAGDGTPYRSYLYAADLAVWLWTILLRGQPMRPYNVGSEAAISIAELARAVARHCTPVPSVHVAVPARPGPPERYVPDTARARRELGVVSTIDLDEALARTMAWHRRSRSPYVVN